MKKEPDSVQYLAAMVNGRREVVAADTKAGAVQAAFNIYTNLRWELKKRDYTKAEVIQKIEAAIKETKLKVLVDDVATEAVGKYMAMIQQVRSAQP